VDHIRDLTKVAAVLLIFAGLFGRHVYNKLVDMEHFVHIAHGRLEAEIQRRHDVNTRCWDAAEKYKSIEGQIHDHLIVLHGMTKSRENHAAKMKEEEIAIIELVKELDALVEKYPGLKSKGPYLYLMEIIQESGLRVITERLNYSDAVYNYNVMRRIFPYMMAANIFGFKEIPFFQTPPNTRG